jgi:hypothetical protein
MCYYKKRQQNKQKKEHLVLQSKVLYEHPEHWRNYTCPVIIEIFNFIKTVSGGMHSCFNLLFKIEFFKLKK